MLSYFNLVMILNDSRVIWQSPLDKVLAPKQPEFDLITGTQPLKVIQLMFEKVKCQTFFFIRVTILGAFNAPLGSCLPV